MNSLSETEQERWIRKLKKEGFDDIKINELPPMTEKIEHDHLYFQVNIVLSGQCIISDKRGSKTYLPGDRIEVEAGTIHIATGGPKGGIILSGLRKK